MTEIVILSVKGGAGKSTIVEGIRQYLQNVEVVDLDHQKTITTALDIVGTPLRPQKVNYRIYDTPPYNDSTLQSLIDKADHIVVPTKLGYTDLIAFRTVYERLLKTKTIDKAILVFNEVRKPLTRKGQDVLKCYEENYPSIKFANTMLSRLDGFIGIFSDPLSGKALLQIKSLVSEIFKV